MQSVPPHLGTLSTLPSRSQGGAESGANTNPDWAVGQRKEHGTQSRADRDPRADCACVMFLVGWILAHGQHCISWSRQDRLVPSSQPSLKVLADAVPVSRHQIRKFQKAPVVVGSCVPCAGIPAPDPQERMAAAPILARHLQKPVDSSP